MINIFFPELFHYWLNTNPNVIVSKICYSGNVFATVLMIL